MEPFTFFISYRRQDTAPIALLLKHEIEKRLQFVRVFVDVEEMRHGDEFPTRIRQLIDRSHATIVLIGDNWMPRKTSGKNIFSKDKDAASHASEDKDWVAEEISYSLSSPVIYSPGSSREPAKRAMLPIFVDTERTFDRFDIPASIRGFAFTHSEAIDYASWPVFIGPLIERLAVKLELQKRPDADEYPKADAGKARTQAVPPEELSAILKYEDYEGWYVDNFGNSDVRYLVKTFKFPHFNEALAFMNLVGEHCRVLDHHPEWRNVFNHVTVSLTTWDARRRVTIYDLNLALFMNKAARAVIA